LSSQVRQSEAARPVPSRSAIVTAVRSSLATRSVSPLTALLNATPAIVHDFWALPAAEQRLFLRLIQATSDARGLVRLPPVPAVDPEIALDLLSACTATRRFDVAIDAIFALEKQKLLRDDARVWRAALRCVSGVLNDAEDERELKCYHDLFCAIFEQGEHHLPAFLQNSRGVTPTLQPFPEVLLALRVLLQGESVNHYGKYFEPSDIFRQVCALLPVEAQWHPPEALLPSIAWLPGDAEPRAREEGREELEAAVLCLMEKLASGAADSALQLELEEKEEGEDFRALGLYLGLRYLDTMDGLAKAWDGEKRGAHVGPSESLYLLLMKAAEDHSSVGIFRDVYKHRKRHRALERETADGSKGKARTGDGTESETDLIHRTALDFAGEHRDAALSVDVLEAMAAENRHPEPYHVQKVIRIVNSAGLSYKAADLLRKADLDKRERMRAAHEVLETLAGQGDAKGVVAVVEGLIDRIGKASECILHLPVAAWNAKDFEQVQRLLVAVASVEDALKMPLPGTLPRPLLEEYQAYFRCNTKAVQSLANRYLVDIRKLKQNVAHGKAVDGALEERYRALARSLLNAYRTTRAAAASSRKAWPRELDGRATRSVQAKMLMCLFAAGEQGLGNALLAELQDALGIRDPSKDERTAKVAREGAVEDWRLAAHEECLNGALRGAGLAADMESLAELQDTLRRHGYAAEGTGALSLFRARCTEAVKAYRRAILQRDSDPMVESVLLPGDYQAFLPAGLSQALRGVMAKGDLTPPFYAALASAICKVPAPPRQRQPPAPMPDAAGDAPQRGQLLPHESCEALWQSFCDSVTEDDRTHVDVLLTARISCCRSIADPSTKLEKVVSMLEEAKELGEADSLAYAAGVRIAGWTTGEQGQRTAEQLFRDAVSAGLLQSPWLHRGSLGGTEIESGARISLGQYMQLNQGGTDPTIAATALRCVLQDIVSGERDDQEKAQTSPSGMSDFGNDLLVLTGSDASGRKLRNYLMKGFRSAAGLPTPSNVQKVRGSSATDPVRLHKSGLVLSKEFLAGLSEVDPVFRELR